MVKPLPTMWETRVRSLGQEDPLEKKMATHSSILVWEILWAEEPGGLQSWVSQRVKHNWTTNTLTHFHFITRTEPGPEAGGNSGVNTWARDFPGGPVVKNSTSNAGDVGSNPSQGTKILHAATELMGAV